MNSDNSDSHSHKIKSIKSDFCPSLSIPSWYEIVDGRIRAASVGWQEPSTGSTICPMSLLISLSDLTQHTQNKISPLTWTQSQEQREHSFWSLNFLWHCWFVSVKYGLGYIEKKNWDQKQKNMIDDSGRKLKCRNIWGG